MNYSYSMNEALVVKNLSKIYKSGSRELQVLANIDFTILQGESISIIGSSGSGKTTLLGLCAGLDTASSGEVSIFGTNLNSLDEDERASLRNDHVGFIFQNFQLIPTLTAIENVMIPLELRGAANAYSDSKALLERVGLGDRLDHYPSQLSGGEQQRVSLARAFSNKPKILFADEPTGNLDEETSDKVESLLFELNRENKTALIIVTHDQDLAKKTERSITLKGGKLIKDVHNRDLTTG